jgi:hypothetical protein
MKMLNKIIGSSIAIAAALAFSASTTQAQNLLVNGGFETIGFNSNPNSAVNPGTPAGFGAGVGSFTLNAITTTSGPGGQSGVNQGWATFGGSQDSMSSAASSPLGGTYSLLAVNNAGNNWNPQGAYQIVDGITPGLYTLSASFLKDSLQNGAWSGTYGTPIALQVNFGNLVGGVWTTVGAASATWGFGPVDGAIPAFNTWYQGSVTLAAPVGATEAEVYLFSMDNGQTSPDIAFFDNASLIAVPEPSTLALLGMGLAVPFYFIRRRKS